MSRHDCIHGPRFCGGAKGWKVLLYLAAMLTEIYYGNAGFAAFMAIGFAWNLDSVMAHSNEPREPVSAHGNRAGGEREPMSETIAANVARKMEAGPELDALIAEHVMGWTRWKEWTDGEMVWATGDEREDGSPTFKGFAPSTDLGHAWKVVEKLTAMPTPWLMEIHNNASARGVRWSVAIDGGAVADTLQLAICRAALLLPEEKPRSLETYGE